ncbi:MAG: hypothetical protein ACRDZ4_19090 [Egibacteraceae bacterium]
MAQVLVPNLPDDVVERLGAQRMRHADHALFAPVLLLAFARQHDAPGVTADHRFADRAASRGGTWLSPTSDNP